MEVNTRKKELTNLRIAASREHRYLSVEQRPALSGFDVLLTKLLDFLKK